MQKQMGQIVKFSLTGVICTVIDYVCYSICLRLGIPYLWAGVIGFAVSVTANYFLSMRYVFVPREDMSKEKQFALFLVMSVIGLGIHECILWLLVEGVYKGMRIPVQKEIMERLAKIAATAVVMVYNYISRKAVLEKKPETE